jgi:hypothetical protein
LTVEEGQLTTTAQEPALLLLEEAAHKTDLTILLQEERIQTLADKSIQTVTETTTTLPQELITTAIPPQDQAVLPIAEGLQAEEEELLGVAVEDKFILIYQKI